MSASTYLRPGRLPRPELRMGLFRDLGRRAERLKRQVEAAAEEPRACRACGESVEASVEACPECGSEDLGPPE